jgi:Protein-tyrosine-phosphatase-like, N-terminal domain
MKPQQLTANRVNEAIDRLTEEFSGRFSPETIRELVASSLESYRGSRITDFVPLLVYRSARDHLAGLAPTTPPLPRVNQQSR